MTAEPNDGERARALAQVDRDYPGWHAWPAALAGLLYARRPQTSPLASGRKTWPLMPRCLTRRPVTWTATSESTEAFSQAGARPPLADHYLDAPD